MVAIVQGFYGLQKTMGEEDRRTADKILELKEKSLKLEIAGLEATVKRLRAELEATRLKAEAEARQKQ